MQRQECQQDKWLDDDHINSYEQFSKNVCDIISSSFPPIKIHHDTTHISLCKLGNCDDSSKCLTISLTIGVYQDMTIAIWYYGIQSTKLSKLDLGWILSHTKCELKWWSQIDNILSRYSSDTAATANSSIISRCQSLASDVESLGVDANKEDRCTFLALQLRLMCTASKGRRYSIDIIIYLFLFFL